MGVITSHDVFARMEEGNLNNNLRDLFLDSNGTNTEAYS